MSHILFICFYHWFSCNEIILTTKIHIHLLHITYYLHIQNVNYCYVLGSIFFSFLRQMELSLYIRSFWPQIVHAINFYIFFQCIIEWICLQISIQTVILGFFNRASTIEHMGWFNKIARQRHLYASTSKFSCMACMLHMANPSYMRLHNT